MKQELLDQQSKRDQLCLPQPRSPSRSQEYSYRQDESGSELRIDRLHDSVQRVRELVLQLGERAMSVPPCVQEYCQRLERFRVNGGGQISDIAERRASKMVKNNKLKRNWNCEDVILLVWLVSKRIQAQNYSHCSQLDSSDWQFISSMISATSPQQCKFKWLSLQKIKLQNHQWSKHQSKSLGEILSTTCGFNWNAIAQQLYERNRSVDKVFRAAKQCREHWNCFINPIIQKGPWNTREDCKLIQYVLQLEGLKKWSEISKVMQGRTQNALKNRYNLLLKKQRIISGNLTEKRLIKLCLNRLMNECHEQERAIVDNYEPEELPSQLSPHAEEPVEKLSSKTQIHKVGLVPKIPQPISYLPNPISFNLGYSGFPNNLGNDQNSFLFSASLGENNGYYIGFLYQSN